MRTYVNLCELVRTYANLSELIRTYANLIELIWTYCNFHNSSKPSVDYCCFSWNIPFALLENVLFSLYDFLGSPKLWIAFCIFPVFCLVWDFFWLLSMTSKAWRDSVDVSLINYARTTWKNTYVVQREEQLIWVVGWWGLDDRLHMPMWPHCRNWWVGTWWLKWLSLCYLHPSHPHLDDFLQK